MDSYASMKASSQPESVSYALLQNCFVDVVSSHQSRPSSPHYFNNHLLALVSQNALLKAYLSIYDRVVDLK